MKKLVRNLLRLAHLSLLVRDYSRSEQRFRSGKSVTLEDRGSGTYRQKATLLPAPDQSPSGRTFQYKPSEQMGETSISEAVCHPNVMTSL